MSWGSATPGGYGALDNLTSHRGGSLSETKRFLKQCKERGDKNLAILDHMAIQGPSGSAATPASWGGDSEASSLLDWSCSNPLTTDTLFSRSPGKSQTPAQALASSRQRGEDNMADLFDHENEEERVARHRAVWSLEKEALKSELRSTQQERNKLLYVYI